MLPSILAKAVVCNCALLEEATTPLRHDVRNRIASVRNLAFFVRRKLSTELAPDRDPRVNDFLAKIEGEWVEYGGKTLNELTDVRRGRRGTAAVSHAATTPVRFGDTFTTEVRLASFREAQEP